MKIKLRYDRRQSELREKERKKERRKESEMMDSIEWIRLREEKKRVGYWPHTQFGVYRLYYIL